MLLGRLSPASPPPPRRCRCCHCSSNWVPLWPGPGPLLALQALSVVALGPQDGTVIHVAKNNVGNKPYPTLIGNRVTVGHGAILHACTVEDDCIIGV